MVRATKGTFDDSLPAIKLTDFSGGLNTMDGAFSLAPNQTPSCQNVIGFPGRLLYCGGFNQNSTLPGPADSAWEFFDVNGTRHQAVWANGNLYDVVTGTYVLIKANVYTTGQQIGRVDQNGILYYTTATVPLRQWDGTTEMAVPNSGGSGVVPPPSGTYLISFAGSLIIANPTVSSVYQRGAILGSNVNDPTTWVAANLTQLGDGNYVEWLVSMGVSNVGVTPLASVLAGTSQSIFLLQGAFDTFKTQSVNCPVGALEPDSAVYLPAADLLGSVVFLGTDQQYWRTNGITAQCISTRILNFVFSSIQNSKAINTAQRFFASYLERYQYYICDIGQNQHLVYRWQTDAWYYFAGWPSGVLIQGINNNGYPSLFAALSIQNPQQTTPLGTQAGIWDQTDWDESLWQPGYAYGLYELGLDNATFGGLVPAIFYNTAYLTGGEPGLTKDWQWVELGTLNNFNTYQVVGTTLPRADNSVLVSQPLQFNNAQAVASTNTGIWDQSSWDASNWQGGYNPFLAQPYVVEGMLSVKVPPSEWVPRVTSQPLRSSAVSFNISWASGQANSGSPAFDIIHLNARFNPRGRKTTGNQINTAQSGALATGGNPFIFPGGQ